MPRSVRVRVRDRVRRPFPLGRKLGLDPRITRVNLAAFLIHCSCSILFLVFLNSSQPFLIHQLSSEHDEPPQKTGSLSGTLIFCDELLSTVLALVWGAAADMYGFHLVASASYLFIAMGLAAYTVPKSAWPGLLVARLIFAVGGSGATAMLSGILAEFSAGTHRVSTASTRQDEAHQSESRPTGGAASEITIRPDTSEITIRPEDSPNTGDQDLDNLESELEPRPQPPSRGESTTSTATQQASIRPSRFGKTKRKHGRLAALAGVSTGFGALVAVFGLLRIPEGLAAYFDRWSGENDKHPSCDLNLRRATVATFWLVAAMSLLVAGLMAIGLRTAEKMTVMARSSSGYGTMQDSIITIQSDSREARRSRLRQRLARREKKAWIPTLKQASRDFGRSAIGGFRLAMHGKHRVGTTSRAYLRKGDLARELRMAYLGGALARAFTIGTTAFLPLLITHHYYASGACKSLPVPDPNSPLPSDSLKQLCRQAFTATAVIGGTAQLAALLLSPFIGWMCDRVTPTLTLSITSTIGSAGLFLLGMGTRSFRGESRKELPDPLSTVSIIAAAAIGFGQIGAIVASLASCARARALINEDLQDDQDEEPEDETEADSEANTLMPSGRRSKTSSYADRAAGTGAGAIAGAYTCTGSISILLVSKLGGWLFDKYAPSPFLLIGGLSAFVATAGFVTALLQARTRRRERLRLVQQ